MNPLWSRCLITILALSSVSVISCRPFSGGLDTLTNRNAATASSDNKVRKIVVLKKDASSPAAVAASAESDHGGIKGFIFNEALRGFSVTISPEGAADLAKDVRIAYIVEDRLLRNTAVSAPEIVQTPQAETIPSGVARSLASNTNSFLNQKAVDATIAVLDTGIDLTHPDLNVTESVSFVGDTSRGNDVYGHGTHVAGTIAAKLNDQGVVGVAPGAKLWAVKVLGDDGSGYLSQIIAGIEYVTQNSDKVDVINMSLGGTGDASTSCGTTSQDPYHDAICGSVAKGIVFVAAAGNNAADGSNFLPAAYPEVISVSALADTDGLPGGKGAASTRGADDSLANFSNFGQVVDIAAPGVSILSTYPGGQYAKLSGTSMATPHVAGAAALYIARNRSQKPKTATDLAKYASQVAAALTSAGFKSGDAAYFTGDPDRYAEPLLNVAAVDPKVTASLSLEASLPKTSFELGKDTSTTLTLAVKDETSAGVTGLTRASFTFELTGTTLTSDSLALQELASNPGTWTGTFNIASLAVGSYTLKISVTDARGITTSGSRTFAITPAQNLDKIVRVSAIRYTTTTDSQGRRVVKIAVEVRSGNNAVVSGLQVSVQVSVSNRNLGSATNTLDALGLARFSVSRAPTGCYSTKATILSKSGYTWDKARDTLQINSCGLTVSQTGSTSNSPAQNTPAQNTPSQTSLKEAANWTGTLLND